MAVQIESRQRHLLTRRCVCCGYDGQLLSPSRTPRCTRCGTDLNQRPPRSYAEMEGLLGRHLHRCHEEPTPLARAIDHGLIHRWLAFCFLIAVMFITIGWLTIAALPV